MTYKAHRQAGVSWAKHYGLAGGDVSNFVPSKSFHISALSKAISPAMRCGFVKAPPGQIFSLNAHRNQSNQSKEINALTEEQYQARLHYHLSVCNDASLLCSSNHGLIIGKKKDYELHSNYMS